MADTRSLFQSGELLGELRLTLVKGKTTHFQALSGLARSMDADTRAFQAEFARDEGRALDASRAVQQQLAAMQAQPSRPPSAGTQSASAPSGHPSKSTCPVDLTHLRGRLRTPDLANSPELGQRIDDMISKAGGLDQAITATRAQLREYERSRDEARQTALAVAADESKIETPCARPEGIYCSANYTYHTMKDAIVLTQGALDAFICNKQSGRR